MQQVLDLLKKIEILAKQEHIGTIDTDLMLDHTRAIYSQLLELRERPLPIAAKTVIDQSFSEVTQVQMPLTLPAEEEQTDMPEKVILELVETEPAGLYAEEDEEEDSTIIGETAEVAIVSDRPAAVLTEEVTTTLLIGDRDIRKHIGINDKYLFINELFENDKDAYERALNEINKCTFCREATDWLTQQAKGRYNWNHENETVQSFYGIVSHFFASR